MGSKKLRARRERRWAEDPHCRHCGVYTIPPEDITGGGTAPNMATLEHLDGRLDPMRGHSGQDELRTTILCYECNQALGRLAEIRWKRWRKRLRRRQR